MSKNRTRDAKPAAAKPVEAAKASTEHAAQLPDAIEHFAALVVSGAGTEDESIAAITAELTTLDPAAVRQALDERVAELRITAGEQAVETVVQDVKKLVADVDKVIVMVPKAFQLTTHAGMVKYAAGAYGMLKEHAEHWYAKAHGVTVVEK